jgi:hypothetical protein
MPRSLVSWIGAWVRLSRWWGGRAILLHQWERNFCSFPQSVDAGDENMSPGGRAILLHQWECKFCSFPQSVDAGDENVSRTRQFRLHRAGSRESSGP